MPSARDHLTVLVDGMKAEGLSGREIAARSRLGYATVWRIEQHLDGRPLLSTYLQLGNTYEKVVGHPPPPIRFGRR